VAFTPDAKILATSGEDGIIELWEVSTGREVRRLKGHSGAVESMAFSVDGRILTSGGHDGVIRLWDTTTGREVGKLISGDPGNWLVTTPESLFDGSPGGWKEINWRFNNNINDVAAVEAFFNDFYYPGLLSEIFAGRNLPTPRVTQRDYHVPQLNITGPTDVTVTSRTIEINIEVTTQSGNSGAQDVRLLRNGSLIKLWPGDVLKGRSMVNLHASVPIAPGENRFTAYAFNHDNIKSIDATIVIKGDERLKRTGTFYILAVGINEYANPEYNLKYAAGDAQTFAEELKKQQEELRDYTPVKVIPLLEREATKANILLALRRFAGGEIELPATSPASIREIKPAQVEDAVIVFFSGHGVAHNNSYYLIPHDLGFGGKRSELNAEALQVILDHSISDKELEQAFERINAAHLILILDAANSGQALEAEEARRGPMNSKGLAQLAYEKGMYILTASQSYQAAMEVSQYRHGLLTFALLEGLTTNKADKDQDGQVTALEWLDYATERVPVLQVELFRNTVRHHSTNRLADETQDMDPKKREVQRPRLFYRRELETQPLVVARP